MNDAKRPIGATRLGDAAWEEAPRRPRETHAPGLRLAAGGPADGVATLRRDTRRRRRGAIAMLAILLAAACLAGCGGPGEPGDVTTSPSPGAGAVLLVLADRDFQQLEYSWVNTTLTNAGYDVTVTTPSGHDARSGDVAVRAEVQLAEADPADYVALVLIGGPGVAAHFDDTTLQNCVRSAVELDKVVGAICLAPVVLARAGVLQGKRATVWKDQRDELERAGALLQDQPVVVDGRIVTGDGPAASEAFAEALVQALR